MNELARMWARKEADRLAALELRKIAAELRTAQAEAAPIIRRANERRKANMRQDGASGFVMVSK